MARRREILIDILRIFFVLGCLAVGALPGLAQQNTEKPIAQEPDATGEVPDKEVRVEPVAEDGAIENRLSRILDASEWFAEADVVVDEGIVVLEGIAQSEEHREWAGRVARTTQDVVAVINRIEVRPSADWNFQPAWQEIEKVARQAQQALPLIVIGIAVLFVTWLAAMLIARLARLFLRDRVASPLLLTVITRAFAIPVLLLGLYLVLQVSGLTRLALTVLGGTGLLGLVIGFAFRDIAENFLASLLLSIRNPFRMGDLVAIADFEGIVRNLNTRSTLLFTLDGNHVQIPNATVYKSVIVNYSSSPSRRTDFVIGIGYDDSTSKAQAIIQNVLTSHDATKDDPPPLVLVDELATSTVNLRAYFWFDSTTYSPIKLRSAMMRQTKRALLENGISMPDEAREVIFPQGLPIYRTKGPAGKSAPAAIETSSKMATETEEESVAAEDGLANEDVLQEEEKPTSPETQDNLLGG